MAQALSFGAARIDPRNIFDAASYLIARQIFDTPFFPPLDVTQDAAPKLFVGRLEPDPERPGRVFRGLLRRDLFFSDGVAFEPHHLAAAVREHPNLSRGVRLTIDGHQATFEVDAENPKFELQLAGAPMVFREPREHAGEVLGTGAYRLGHTSDLEFVLVRNAHHVDVPPIAEIVFRSYPSDDRGRPRALLAALESGEVDLAPRLNWRDMVHLQRTAKVLRPVNSTGSLYFNTERLRSRGFRRALAFALNRLEIAQAAFGDNALAFQATGLLPPALGRQVDGIAHSAAIARRLLDEEGSRSTAPLKLATMFSSRPYLPDPLAVAEVIKRQLDKVGVALTVTQPANPDAYRDMIVGGEYDMLLSGNIADSPDPADFLRDVLGSAQIPDAVEKMPHGFNFARFRDPGFDAALAAYRAERKPEGLQRLTQVLAEEVPVFPLLYGRAAVAHSWRLKGFQPSVTSAWDFSRLSLR